MEHHVCTRITSSMVVSFILLNHRSAEFGDLFVLQTETCYLYLGSRVLFEKTEPGLKREIPETKASEMLFCFATSASKNFCDVFANLSCEIPHNVRVTHVQI
jgi:hypothetical protein